MNNTPTALKRQTKDTLIAQILEASEEREALTVRYGLCLALGALLGYALAVY